jgi:glycosyltransferase involved in cell wall biosynthesis
VISSLVSIIVTTYNSAKYVVETLESARAQTWENVELIISDDCSTDETIDICRKWVASNQHRFVRTEILTVPQNLGVSASCNRSINACKADWIKIIAGDDILFPDCIKDNMNFVGANPMATIIFSQVKVYAETFDAENLLATDPGDYPANLMGEYFCAADQYKILLLSDRINYTPSYFFKKQTIFSVGGYDEENRLVEDYPMWLKLTAAGNRLFYFHKPTVGYRRHQAAASNVAEYGLFKPLLIKSGPLREQYVYPNLPWDIASSEKHILRMSKLFQRLGLNKRNSTCKFLYKLSTIYINPFRYMIFFKKKILGFGKRDIFYKEFNGT